MKTLTAASIGRSFLGICIGGLGVIHFVVPGIRPVLAPIPPESIPPASGYLIGVVLTTLGLMLTANLRLRTFALATSIILALFLLIGHLPQRLMSNPTILGFWTDAIKLLALTGGALIAVHADETRRKDNSSSNIEVLTKAGKYMFALMLMLFGIDHFLYDGLVKTIVPGWIPGPLIWTYITGVALAGAGVSILIRFKVKIIMYLLATMLFLWVAILHTPDAVGQPLGDGNAVISLLECLAFCGIALMIADTERQEADNSIAESDAPATGR